MGPLFNLDLTKKAVNLHDEDAPAPATGSSTLRQTNQVLIALLLAGSPGRHRCNILTYLDFIQWPGLAALACDFFLGGNPISLPCQVAPIPVAHRQLPALTTPSSVPPPRATPRDFPLGNPRERARLQRQSSAGRL